MSDFINQKCNYSDFTLWK